MFKFALKTSSCRKARQNKVFHIELSETLDFRAFFKGNRFR